MPNRTWLMSTVSLPALMPYLRQQRATLAEIMVHRWVKAELGRIREDERQAAAKLDAPKAA